MVTQKVSVENVAAPPASCRGGSATGLMQGWQRHRLHAGAAAPTARLDFSLTARFSSPTRLAYPMLRLRLLDGCHGEGGGSGSSGFYETKPFESVSWGCSAGREKTKPLAGGPRCVNYETKPCQRHRLHAGAAAPTARLDLSLTTRFSSLTRLAYPMLRLLLPEGYHGEEGKWWFACLERGSCGGSCWGKRGLDAARSPSGGGGERKCFNCV